MKITNEDCMQLMSRYPDKYFDLAIVDPPYFKGVGKLGFFGKRSSSINVKRGDYAVPEWDGNIPGEAYFAELLRVSKEQIIWGCNYYAGHIPSVGRIVWDKVNGDSSFSDCELASCSIHDSVRLFVYMWNGMNQAKSLAEPRTAQGNKKLNEKRIHPTQKPVDLYRWLLSKYAKPGDKILDTHLGSGSIAIACHDYGFDLTASELSPNYYNAAMKRLRAYQAQTALEFLGSFLPVIVQI